MPPPRSLSQARVIFLAVVWIGAALTIGWLAGRKPPVDRARLYKIGYGDDAPLHFQDTNGEPTGLAVELVREAARRQGIRLVWSHDSGFNQQKFDMWVLQTDTPQRRKTVHLTEPYLQSESCFIVRADSAYRDPASLRNARVSHVNWPSQRQNLALLVPHAHLLPVTSSDLAIAALSEGRADAAYVNQYAILTSLLHGGSPVPFRIIAAHETRSQMSLASTAAAAPVADLLRDAMRDMAAEGAVTQAVERWAFFPNLTTDVISQMAREKHRERLLVAGLVGVTILLVLVTGLAVATSRRSAQLRRAKDLLARIADQVPGVVYQYRLRPDGTRHFPYASEAIRTIYRLSPEEANKQSSAVTRILHPDDAAKIEETIQQSARNLSPWVHEYRVRFPDGTIRWLRGNAVPQREADGSTLWHGFITDITEQKQAEINLQALERKIQQTQKLESLGVLAGGIAHDFNNILTGIIGNASLATLELPEDSAVIPFLRSITEGSKQAADLCRQMLAYSGRGRFVVRAVSVNRIVEETTKLLQIAVSKNASLRLELVPDLPAITADETQLRQVIMNLVINASDAIGDQQGAIRISTSVATLDPSFSAGAVLAPDSPEKPHVCLEVSDSGCGMSPEVQARIFDPFYTTKFTGRGLGLSAVLGILRGHKGGLKIDSQLGHGTTFTLCFPVAPVEEQADTKIVQAHTPWKASGLILVVDDDETIRRATSAMLQKLGFAVQVAEDGARGLEAFRADPSRFTLVLLDLTMPNKDGESVFVDMKALKPDVRVILMSGFSEKEATARFVGKGLASFLQKPFGFDDLRTLLASVLGP